MDFALCPDDGPPRLWRFVAPGVLPPGVLSTLDREQNILVIDKEIYDTLPWIDQHQTLRTHAVQINVY
jgi:hypothetical protein